MDPIKLPSGRELRITMSPFAVGRDLYQAALEEIKGVTLDMDAEIDGNFFKDLFCVGASSKKIEKCLWKCLEKAVIDGEKITEDSFESEEHRGDYFDVMYEVGRVNIFPFTKSLYVKYGHLLALLQKTPS